jgi:NitT/TauT family transport system permease protein
MPALSSTFKVVIGTLAALPILALAPMFLIWFGPYLALKVAIAALLSGIVFAGQVMSTDAAIGPDLRTFMLANRLPRSVQVQKIILPLLCQHMLEEFPTAANAAFLGVFVGEFVAAEHGIGHAIFREGALFHTDLVLAETLAALFLLLGLQIGVRVLRRQIQALIERATLDPIFSHVARPGR